MPNDFRKGGREGEFVAHVVTGRAVFPDQSTQVHHFAGSGVVKFGDFVTLAEERSVHVEPRVVGFGEDFGDVDNHWRGC